MSKPELTVKVTLTPAQALGILVAIETRQTTYEDSTRWTSQFRGAHYRVRNALIDAGWAPNPDGKSWLRR